MPHRSAEKYKLDSTNLNLICRGRCLHRPASCRESAFYLCYRIFVEGCVLDAPQQRHNHPQNNPAGAYTSAGRFIYCSKSLLQRELRGQIGNALGNVVLLGGKVKDAVGDAMKFVKENEMVKMLSHNGNIFAVEPPLFVELEITETGPGF